jgi:ribosome maturation protein Sdo1
MKRLSSQKMIDVIVTSLNGTAARFEAGVGKKESETYRSDHKVGLSDVHRDRPTSRDAKIGSRDSRRPTKRA